MRIARFSSAGHEPRYGIVELSEDHGDYPDTVTVLDSDPLAGPVSFTGERIDLTDVRLLAPIIPRSKIIAVGRNYAAHAAELGNEVPAEPLLFMKPNTSIIGPGDPIIRPASLSNDVHYEGELAVVIKRICRQVPVERVSEVIFGYTCANDVTARDLQNRDSQWTRAKGFDTFCPIGPWVVGHLSIQEAQELHIRTQVSGQIKQDASTSLMIHSIPTLISAISDFCTLLPGDIILTGTPAGVGPLVAGDSVSVTIDGIGTLTNPVIDEQ